MGKTFNPMTLDFFGFRSFEIYSFSWGQKVSYNKLVNILRFAGDSVNG